MNLARTLVALTALGDESRLRLCALLRERELRVSELVRATGLAQSGVSTHLGRLKEAGFVRDRRHGAQSYYALAADALPAPVRALIDDAAASDDPTLRADRERLARLEAERRGDLPDTLADDLQRYYSPGRTWQSLAAGLAALIRLEDALDVGCGEGAATACLAPHCARLTAIDVSPRALERARERLARFPHVEVAQVDAHDLPYASGRFDAATLLHTLTHAATPERVLGECARVLRPGGRLVLLCLARHRQQEVTARYGERHPGFSPRALRALLERAGLRVRACEPVSREPRKPYLEVLLGVAEKPGPRPPAQRATR